MAQRIDHLREMRTSDAAVAELPFISPRPKEYSAPSLVTTRMFQLQRTDALRAFDVPRQQLVRAGAPVAVLPMMIPAPTEYLAPLCHGQAVIISCHN